MGVYSVVVSLILIIFIPLFEFFRKKEGKFDYLSLFNLIYLLAYGVVPLYIYSFPEATRQWRVMLNNNEADTHFFIGALIALLFYLVVIVSYYFSSKLSFVAKAKETSINIFSKTKGQTLFKPALFLLIIGGLSLLVYMNIAGGLSQYIRIGYLTRTQGQILQHPLVFVKNFTPLLYVASFMFFAFIRHSKGTAKFINISLFAISFIGSVLVVFHSGGRMTFFIYFITFPLAILLYQNKIKIRSLLIGAGFFIFIVIYGNSLLNVEAELQAHYTEVSVVNSLVREISFPFINTGTSYNLFPQHFDFRGGIPDIATAIGGLVPQRIINIEFLQGESISDFNTTLYRQGGVMPVDIVSFGYMSFGTAGVIIVAFLFGILVKWTENLFSYRKNLVGCMFSVALMIALSFRVMYGDPALFLSATFRYIVAMVVIWGFLKLENMPKIVWNKAY